MPINCIIEKGFLGNIIKWCWKANIILELNERREGKFEISANHFHITMPCHTSNIYFMHTKNLLYMYIVPTYKYLSIYSQVLYTTITKFTFPISKTYSYDLFNIKTNFALMLSTHIMFDRKAIRNRIVVSIGLFYCWSFEVPVSTDSIYVIQYKQLMIPITKVPFRYDFFFLVI